jgi:hypothetical protein
MEHHSEIRRETSMEHHLERPMELEREVRREWPMELEREVQTEMQRGWKIPREMQIRREMQRGWEIPSEILLPLPRPSSTMVGYGQDIPHQVHNHPPCNNMCKAMICTARSCLGLSPFRLHHSSDGWDQMAEC